MFLSSSFPPSVVRFRNVFYSGEKLWKLCAVCTCCVDANVQMHEGTRSRCGHLLLDVVGGDGGADLVSREEIHCVPHRSALGMTWYVM